MGGLILGRTSGRFSLAGFASALGRLASKSFVAVQPGAAAPRSSNLLEVSPSAVSRVIAALEGGLGFTLFHRTTRRLSLTVDGAVYLERCRQILNDLQEAETEGRQRRITPSGTVKVGMHPAFRNAFFGEIANFFDKNPELRVETKIANSPSILFDEGFDVLIRAGDLADLSVVARSIGWLEMVVAGPYRHELTMCSEAVPTGSFSKRASDAWLP
jgi:LysR family transcriptional regulator for bpeEF and oprC